MMQRGNHQPVSPRLCRGVAVRGNCDIACRACGQFTNTVFRASIAHPTPRQSQGLKGQSRGFTLIEMVVVIGIIVLLAALTVAVSTTLSRKAEQRQAEDTLKLLEMALTEWETAADRQLTFGPVGAGVSYDYDEALFLANDALQQEQLVSRVVEALSRNTASSQVLSQIDADYLVHVDDTTFPNGSRRRLVDPWDKPYRIIFPGRAWLSGSDPNNRRDDDTTFRTDSELIHGICINRKIAFVSAGPDGDFGDLQLTSAPNTPANSGADDNMYSSPVKTRLP